MRKQKNGEKNGGHRRQWSLSAEVDPILIPEGQPGQLGQLGNINETARSGDSSLRSLPRRLSGRWGQPLSSSSQGGSPGLLASSSLPRAIPISSSQKNHSRDFSESRQTPLKMFNNFSPKTFNSSLYNNQSSKIPPGSSFSPILNTGRSPSTGFGYSYGATPQQGEESMLTEEQVARILSEHLVQKESARESKNDATGDPFGTVSHSLLGGETTRAIYHWEEKRNSLNGSSRQRRNSEPDLRLATVAEGGTLTASDLREPGVFRRFFVASKAEREGKKPANIVTRNFIDFLLLYGYYGGDIYPSDDEYEDDGEEKGPSDLEHFTERTPLVTHSRTSTTSMAVQGTSARKAFFMLLKAFVGTGVLFLPQAFKNGGLIFSTIMMLVLGFLSLHCMILLVEASRAMGGLSFGDLGGHLYGPRMKQLVLGSIAISQMGFCCAYFIFVGTNLRYLTMIISGCKWVLPDWFFIAVQIVVYIPLSWVRRIKHFSITSLIADVFILLGLGYIFGFDVYKIATNGLATDTVWMNYESFPLFIGTAMFAFEGICLILPIAESMKKPEEFTNVISICMVVIGGVFITIGLMGYLAFGTQLGTVIFLDLPQGPVPNGLQFFYAIAIMLSFPLCVYPAIRITEQAIFGLKDGKSSNLVKWQKNMYRATLVSLLGAVAWAGAKDLDKVVSLVGCFACIPLSFIYPALFHYKITKSTFSKITDMLLVVFGTLAMFYTTSITLAQWAIGGPSSPNDQCY